MAVSTSAPSSVRDLTGQQRHFAKMTDSVQVTVVETKGLTFCLDLGKFLSEIDCSSI